jgi:hypothetical protein
MDLSLIFNNGVPWIYGEYSDHDLRVNESLIMFITLSNGCLRIANNIFVLKAYAQYYLIETSDIKVFNPGSIISLEIQLKKWKRKYITFITISVLLVVLNSMLVFPIIITINSPN